MDKVGTLSERALFAYNTKHLAYKDKVRFYYALKGREGNAGIIQSASIEQLGKTVLLVPKEQAANVEDFLKFWKCAFTRRRVILDE